MNSYGVSVLSLRPKLQASMKSCSAGTARGFGEAEFETIGALILRVLDALSTNPEGDAAAEAEVRAVVRALCAAFPIYGA